MVIINKFKCDQERISKSLRYIFKDHGFDITIVKGLFQTDFLDFRLKLRNNLYEPLKKEIYSIKYINNQSNHPKTVRKSTNP